MKKILAANRGEIAIRIMRAATELGLRTATIYSDEDRLSLHRFKADEAYVIGRGKGPVAAYMDVEGIIALAKNHGIDAIHPGYGFLSENRGLADACRDAGITFIGPPPELLTLLGNKVQARRLAEQAGVPVVPGLDEPVSNVDEACAAAEKIGFPIIIKAAFGGGGRGMRVVHSEPEFRGKLEEAQKEALVAAGDGAVFLERFIERARHIEVQILADAHGNVLHLHERDCSVQRRHQKIVEVAPAANLPTALRDALCGAAVKLAREAGYVNAGTVEFLLDVDKNEWFFIEVNPRVQVEHTVTETVVGIDIVQSQILIAQGFRLHEPPLSLPEQKDVNVRGFALQCRITTEDPESQFAPDYGRITTYRSPAGLGIRLDGATAYAGSVINPYYDSLLVKMTAWHNTLDGACHRADRALREFRIRGVKTNIPFLLNVVNHAAFQSGEVTTSFLDRHSELFAYKKPQDRATRLLRYIASVIVNGNATVKGRPAPKDFEELPAVAFEQGEPPPGTRQRLQQLGPGKFAAWVRDEKPLLLTDTTFRDAHQSLLATRVRTFDLLQTSDAVAHRLHNLFSLEMWGGATFDATMRFLHEDPWQRLRQLRERVPNICFQMLLRASNAVGYTSYPDNVVREFVLEAARQGIDVFRISIRSTASTTCRSRWTRSAKPERSANRRSATPATFSTRAAEVRPCLLRESCEAARADGRAHSRHQGHGGLCKPYAAFDLVRALKQEIGLPIHFHTHDSSGLNAATLLKAAEADVDIVDGAVASLSGQTSQPNLNSLVESLRNTPRDTGLDIDALNDCSRYWETVRTYYKPFDDSPAAGSASLYQHEIPGGQYTNLKQQASAMGLRNRWPEVERMYARVNQLFGDIVKVTPSSKVVGDMALFLIVKGMTPEDVLRLSEDHDVAFPDSVVDLFAGSLGTPPRRLAGESAEDSAAGQNPDHRPPGSDLAAGRLRRRRTGTGAEGPGAELAALSGGVRQVQQDPARGGRCERDSYADLFLRDGIRQGVRHRHRARQNAGDQVPDDRRPESGRHAGGVLRVERTAAPGDGSRRVVAGEAANASEGASG